MQHDDEPEITISLRRTRNPLVWAFSIARLIATAGFAVFGCALISVTPIGLLFAALGAVLFGLEAWRLFDVDQSVFRFFPDRLAIDRVAPRKPRGTENYRLDQLCHFELASLGELRIDILVAGERWQREVIRLPATSGEDTFDACTDHLQRWAPKHLHSIAQPDALLLSMNRDPLDLIPGLTDPVREVRGRDLASTIRVGSVDLEAEARPPQLDHENSKDVRILHAADGTVAVLADDTIRTSSGVVVARLRNASRHGAVEVQLSDGTTFLVHRAHIDTDDGASIGAVTQADRQISIQFEPVVPGALALVMMIAWHDGNRRIRLPRTPEGTR